MKSNGYMETLSELLEAKEITPLTKLKSRRFDDTSEFVTENMGQNPNTSLTYEEGRKKRSLRCLGINLVCQLLIIIAAIVSLVFYPWLKFDFNCLHDESKSGNCNKLEVSILMARIYDI